MAITKVTKPVAPYQVFTSAEVGGGSIIDVQGSLGGHPARHVVFENPSSVSGISFKLNVCEKIYYQYGDNFYPQTTGFQGGRSPVLINEILTDRPTITLSATSGLTIDTMAVVDIQLVTFDSDARIIVW